MPEPERDSAPQEAPQSRVVKKVKKVKRTSAQPTVEPGTPPAAPPHSPKEPSAPPQPHAPSYPSSEPVSLPPPPPGYVPQEPPARAPAPAQAAEGKPTVESRISSIDIDKLTDELEKDILISLHNEISGLLTPPPAPAPVNPRPAHAQAPADRATISPEPAMTVSPQPSKTLALTRAIESEQRERRVAHRLGKEFDKLPVNMRNELIKTLARTDDVKVREDVVIAVASNFGKLPPEVQSLLKTLAADQDSKVREEVAFELNRNFNKISPDFRFELLQLLSRDVDIKVREDIVAAIAGHYDEDTDRMRALLRTLASDKKSSVRDQVAIEMKRNSDLIPGDHRAELEGLIGKAASEDSRRKE